MTAPTLPDGADGPAVLNAFLRGIERRGLVFADLQAGNRALSEQAFAVALRQFREQAGQHPYGTWTRLFWRTLCALPGVQAAGPAARWDDALADLALLDPGSRAVLLLRLLVGLTDTDAAEVLGIALPSYRQALLRALPRREDGSGDPVRWGVLAGAIQEAVHAIPAERLAHLARLREAAVQGRRPDLIGPMPPPDPLAGSIGRANLRLCRLLWVGVGLCALGLVATFVQPAFGPGGGDAGVRTTALRPAASPRARYDAQAALLTERDFELLVAADPSPPADDPAFYAWYAAGAPATAAEEDAARDTQAPVVPESSTPESIDAP